MNERNKPDSLKDLDDRLRRLREQEEGKKPKPKGIGDPRSGLGLAMRIGVEIVAAIAVGVGIGLLLDYWLGTKPWMMVAFFVLGAAAGMMNVYRVMTGLSAGVGLGNEMKRKDEGKSKD